jgi:hypothetical protein
MIVDGASSHKGKELIVPKNMDLIILPPYSPELNPTEIIWNFIRRDYFCNRVFYSLYDAIAQVKIGLSNMAADKPFLKSLTFCNWICNILSGN